MEIHIFFESRGDWSAFHKGNHLHREQKQKQTLLLYHEANGIMLCVSNFTL